MKINSDSKNKTLEISELISDAAAFGLILIIVIYVALFSGSNVRLPNTEKQSYINVMQRSTQNTEQEQSGFQFSDEIVPAIGQNIPYTPEKPDIHPNPFDYGEKSHETWTRRQSNDDLFKSLWNFLASAENLKSENDGKSQNFGQNELDSLEYHKSPNTLEKRLKSTQTPEFKKLLSLVAMERNPRIDSTSRNELIKDWSFLVEGELENENWSFLASNIENRETGEESSREHQLNSKSLLDSFFAALEE